MTGWSGQGQLELTLDPEVEESTRLRVNDLPILADVATEDLGSFFIRSRGFAFSHLTLH